MASLNGEGSAIVTNDININNIRINPEDIVGKVFGVYKVNKYIGQRRGQARNGKCGPLEHLYEVECTVCGSKRISTRNTVKRIYTRKRKKCIICHGRTLLDNVDKKELYTVCHEKAMDTWRENKAPSSDNVSTGIKRYSISFLKSRCKGTGEYTHRVEISVDGKSYVLLRIYDKSDRLLPECVELANELNEVMSHGKGYFYWWYENIFKKNPK